MIEGTSCEIKYQFTALDSGFEVSCVALCTSVVEYITCITNSLYYRVSADFPRISEAGQVMLMLQGKATAPLLPTFFSAGLWESLQPQN